MTFLSVIEYGVVAYVNRHIDRKKKKKDEHTKNLMQHQLAQNQKENKIQRLSIIQRIELEPKGYLRRRHTNCN